MHPNSPTLGQRDYLKRKNTGKKLYMNFEVIQSCSSYIETGFLKCHWQRQTVWRTNASCL